jgi:hypothetical protein
MAVGDGARMSDLRERDQLGPPEADVPGVAPLGENPEVPVLPVVAAGVGEMAPTLAAPPLVSPTAPLDETVSEPRRASPLLRLWRLLGGIGALAAAWGFTVVLLVLYNAMWGFVSGPEELLARVGVAVSGALVALWLAVAVIACLLAGAYCLMLGLTRRSW